MERLMQLVKPALDVGLYTNNLDSVLAFWQQQANVPFSELLPVGGGVHQHRHAIGDSVLKINHSRTALPSGASGLQADHFQQPHRCTPTVKDPDGNPLNCSDKARCTKLAAYLKGQRHNRQRTLLPTSPGLKPQRPRRVFGGRSVFYNPAKSVTPTEGRRFTLHDVSSGRCCQRA